MLGDRPQAILLRMGVTDNAPQLCLHPENTFAFFWSYKAQGSLSHRAANHLGLPGTVLVLVLKVSCPRDPLV